LLVLHVYDAKVNEKLPEKYKFFDCHALALSGVRWSNRFAVAVVVAVAPGARARAAESSLRKWLAQQWHTPASRGPRLPFVRTPVRAVALLASQQWHTQMAQAPVSATRRGHLWQGRFATIDFTRKFARV
jgi:hypothetical protein